MRTTRSRGHEGGVCGRLSLIVEQCMHYRREPMAVSLSLLSILLLLACTGVRCNVIPICDQSTYFLGPSDPSLPTLPTQFSTTVQAVIQSGGPMEITVREYFDEVGNRGRLGVAFNGTSRYLIFDFSTSRQIFNVLGTECNVEEVEETNQGLREVFGFGLQDGTPHVGTVAHFFRVDTDSVLFLPPEDVRGIPCNHWQSCFTFPNRSYTIDYYFSRNDTDDWTSSYGSDLIPVMIIVNGTNEDTSSNTTRSVTNTYTFVDFNSGPDSVPDDVFRVPNSLSCKGRAPGMALPSLPNYYSAFFEAVNEDEKTVDVFREYYDFENQLFRVDFYSDGDEDDGDLSIGPHTFIQDFNLETRYVIDRRYGNCSVSAIEPQGSFDVTVSNGRATLVSSAQLFFLDNTFSYEGVSTVRGVEVDSWISYIDFRELRSGGNLSDTLYEVFFTRPEWEVGTHSSFPTSESSLWRSRFTGTITYVNDTTNNTETREVTGTYDSFAFNRGEPDQDVFDTSVCVDSSQYYIVGLFIPVTGVEVDFSKLPQNLRIAISGFTKVTALQVGNIQVVGGDATELILTFHISNISSVSIPALGSTPPVSAYQAITALQNSATVNNKKLDFTINLSTDGAQNAQPQLAFIRNENGTVYRSSSSESDSDDDDGLSDGAIAGIAVWMFILGVGLGVMGTLGVLLLAPCLRKRSFTLAKVSYKKHEDEQVTVSE